MVFVSWPDQPHLSFHLSAETFLHSIEDGIFGSQATWVQILAPPLTSCAILSQVLMYFTFPICKMQIRIEFTSYSCYEE